MNKLEGVITAIVTPFKNDRLDLGSLETLLKQQLESHVSGFVVGGTTGESPTISKDELEAVYHFVRKNSPASCNVILGTGTNSTADTLQKTQWAEKLGADAALVVTPYYNKPPQSGLIAHYEAVAEQTSIPILIYNVPGRTGVSIQPETVATLSKSQGIVGIKDATGDLKIVEKMRQMVSDDFLLLSGDDGTAVDYCLGGGHGVISVISHLIPAELSQFVARARRGDLTAAEEYKTFLNLIDLIFIESNPIPVKAGLKAMGLIETDDVRLPLISMSEVNRKLLISEMETRHLFKGRR